MKLAISATLDPETVFRCSCKSRLLRARILVAHRVEACARKQTIKTAAANDREAGQTGLSTESTQGLLWRSLGQNVLNLATNPVRECSLRFAQSNAKEVLHELKAVIFAKGRLPKGIGAFGSEPPFTDDLCSGRHDPQSEHRPHSYALNSCTTWIRTALTVARIERQISVVTPASTFATRCSRGPNASNRGGGPFSKRPNSSLQNMHLSVRQTAFAASDVKSLPRFRRRPREGRS